MKVLSIQEINAVSGADLASTITTAGTTVGSGAIGSTIGAARLGGTLGAAAGPVGAVIGAMVGAGACYVYYNYIRTPAPQPGTSTPP
jgi:hypothetical protein